MTADGRRAPRARRHPERGAARAAVALRRHLPPAAHRRPRRRPRARPAAAAGSSTRDGPRPIPPTTPGSPSPSPTRGLEALGVPQELARQLRAGVPPGDGGARGAAGRRRREQPGALGAAARQQRRPRRPGGALPRRGAARRPWSRRHAARTQELAGRRGDLAPGLLPAPDRADVVRLQGRDRPAGGRGQRQPAVEPEGAAAQGRRDHPRLSGRDRRAAADADAGGARPQRHLRRVPQAAHEGRGLPAVPAREGREPRGGGAARREDGRALAERRPARALARSATTRSSAPTRSATTTSSTPTTRAASSARPARTRGARTRATRSTTTAASTSACTA